MIYNQGFEVTILGRRYFAFSYYKKTGNETESICDTTFPGWVHDLDEWKWGCYTGEKQEQQSTGRNKKQNFEKQDDKNLFKISESFIAGLTFLLYNLGQ